MKKENGTSKLNGNGRKPKINEVNDNKAIHSLMKAVTLTRKRLYPEIFDEKDKLKAEYGKNNI